MNVGTAKGDRISSAGTDDGAAVGKDDRAGSCVEFESLTFERRVENHLFNRLDLSKFDALRDRDRLAVKVETGQTGIRNFADKETVFLTDFLDGDFASFSFRSGSGENVSVFEVEDCGFTVDRHGTDEFEFQVVDRQILAVDEGNLAVLPIFRSPSNALARAREIKKCRFGLELACFGGAERAVGINKLDVFNDVTDARANRHDGTGAEREGRVLFDGDRILKLDAHERRGFAQRNLAVVSVDAVDGCSDDDRAVFKPLVVEGVRFVPQAAHEDGFILGVAREGRADRVKLDALVRFNGGEKFFEGDASVGDFRNLDDDSRFRVFRFFFGEFDVFDCHGLEVLLHSVDERAVEDATVS